MAVASSLGSVKIRGNIIDIGYVSNGVSDAYYAYDSCMSIASSSAITDNTISGCLGGSGGSTNLVTITAGSSIICHNTFIRDGYTINRYISVTSSNDLIITHNIFDQSTTDGANTTLVSGQSGGTIYANNLNQ